MCVNSFYCFTHHFTILSANGILVMINLVLFNWKETISRSKKYINITNAFILRVSQILSNFTSERINTRFKIQWLFLLPRFYIWLDYDYPPFHSQCKEKSSFFSDLDEFNLGKKYLYNNDDGHNRLQYRPTVHGAQ